ncbi:AraC family transcriptional regulator [Paenibacillus sp. N3.4]|uniref:AraC family transcriptional regulator n=1 Tax=Paenibacillus sp. N3.4 TaxID=2603222 RepID=UPI001650B9EC|nr:AraC family transcriptional regulator [Paenibacillus sp. N3.4]
MTIKRSVSETPGELFFLPDLPLYVNRVYESFHLQQHTHDFIEISYVAQGSGAHYINDSSLPVTKGDLFFIPVGVSHVFRPSSTEQMKPLVVYNCIFTAEWLGQLLQAQPSRSSDDFTLLFAEAMDNCYWLSFKERDGEFQPLFERLHFEYTARRSGFMTILQASVAQLLVYMHRTTDADYLKEIPKSTLQDLDSLLAHIRQHVNTPLTLKQAAERLSISERQLHRQFKKHTGMSFMAYVQHARIEACCQQLRDTNHKISDIAERIGYQDMKYFNQLFKKMTGITPSYYRNQMHTMKKSALPSK